MLTDEEIEAIEGKLGWPSPVKFARAVIAAHEAKRMPPEEWLSKTKSLIDDLKDDAIHYGGSNGASGRYAMDAAYNALITHISTPPAPKLDISEEEMRREFERIHGAADLNRGEVKNQLYTDACTLAAWIGFQSAIKMMQERCK